MRFWFAALVALVVLPGSPAAQEGANTGAQWLRRCDGADGHVAELACLKYLMTLDEHAARLARTRPGVAGCPPSDVTIGQVKEIVVDYMHRHPERLHLRLLDLALEAQREAFPCGRPPQRPQRPSRSAWRDNLG